MGGDGPEADIIITSRIRLARNLAGMPFPHCMHEKQGKQIVEQVKQALQSLEIGSKVGKFDYARLDELSLLDRQILVEKHLISPQHAEEDGVKAVALSQDESVSIMVNEEDHLRLQCIFPALRLQDCWRLADELDDVLEQTLNFSFDQNCGYLTACPTNTGTGLRASVMAHLPVLVMTKQAGRVLAALSQVGLAVRGLYGEGTEAIGNLFQISNQITLGKSEEEIVQNLEAVAIQVVNQERRAREALQKKIGHQLEDRLYRAYGILTNARVISSEEALSLLSELRLGVDLHIIEGIGRQTINELMVTIQPAYLQGLGSREMSPLERDAARAELIREYIQKK